MAVAEGDTDDSQTVKARVRRGVLRAYQRCRLRDKRERGEMEQREHCAWFSLDATVLIVADDRPGSERPLCHCAYPSCHQLCCI
jgi:hypothetical protein